MDDGTLSAALALGRARLKNGVVPSELRLGATETFRVVRRVGSGRVRLASARFSLTAQDGGLLAVGTRVRLRLLSLSPQIRFQVADDSSFTTDRALVKAFLLEHRMAETPAVVMLAQTIVLSRRPLTAPLLRAALRLWRMLRLGEEDSGKRYARAVVEAADRTLGSGHLDDVSLSAIASYVEWRANLGSRSRSQPDHPAANVDTAVSEMGEYLRRSTELPNDIVQLANALEPSGDVHWIEIPVGARRGSDSVSAIVRVAWNTRAGRAERAVVVAVSERWGPFWFQFDLPNAVLTAVGRSEEGAKAADGELRRFIASLHSTAEPRTMEGDGFDLEAPSISPGELDRYG